LTDKTTSGRFFEDFRVGEVIRHATPRTVTAADAALYIALTGSRFAPQSAVTAAAANGLESPPIDELLAFHVVFGKTVPDVSLNAVANLGYAEGRFHRLVMPGDTLFARSEVIGLKETSSGKAGIVHVRTTGTDHLDRLVVDYCRWVMVNKRDTSSPAPAPVVPALAAAVPPTDLAAPRRAGSARSPWSRRWRAHPTPSRTMPWASGSTMSTAWGSWTASIGWRRASTRTPPACISTTMPSEPAGSAP
jgi:2-methylfumaryl-CoA hydratase